ncbi:MAG: hypothetical protein DHS20C16_37160 [Phycisphaerae bacterium]|nr:MAG: hypothetical protein DHS20C16_37160 [Phycisphaerae bacterium]
MTTFYLICAVFGATIMVVQFLLQLLGIGELDHHDPTMELEMGSSVDANGQEHGHSEFFKLLSLRTMVSGTAFFGITGLLGESIALAPIFVFLLAAAVGLAAMVVVAWLMSILVGLHSEGNLDVRGAMGRIGTVYLSIPKEKNGQGKVTVSVQERSLEFDAITNDRELTTGESVLVIDVVDDHTLEVVSASAVED